MNATNLRAAERHTYEVMCPEDPRWTEIFARAPRIVTKYHGPLPEGPVSDLCVMFLVRVVRSDGYDETVYFANSRDVERWHGSTGVGAKLSKEVSDGVLLFEKIALDHPEWTVAQILDSVGA